MKKSNKNKRKKALIIVIGIIFVIIVIIASVIVLIRQTNNTNPESAELVVDDMEQANNEAELQSLYNMTEQERITYYCAEFFKLVDKRNYEEAYNLLYDEYKENYFPTEASFSQYMREYFPEDFSLSYTNFERLGDIYVLWVSVSDTLNGSLGHNFDMNVVIKENDFNDYVLSFSRNSAVEEE